MHGSEARSNSPDSGRSTSAKSWPGYVVAIAGTGVAALLGWGLGRLLGPDVHLFSTFYLFIMLSALLGGTGAGLLATALSAAAVAFFFLPPIFSLWVSEPADEVGIVLFCGINVAASFICGALRTARVRTQAEARRAEAAADALRESEEQFRTFFDSAAFGAAQVDMQRRFIAVNERYCQLTGFTCDELMGTTPADLVHSEDRERDSKAFQEFLNSRRPVYEAEKRYIRKDGQVIWVRVTSALLRDARGQPWRTAGIIEDITERKKAEDALRRSADEQRILSEVLAELLSSNETDRIVRRLFERVAVHIGAEIFFNFMMDAEAQVLHLNMFQGVPSETAREIYRLEVGAAICGKVAEMRAPIVVTNIQNSSDERADVVRRFGIQTYACYPLISGQRLMGTLSFASRNRREFDPSELEFIRLIASHSALALDRARTAHALRESEERFRLLADTISQFAWIADHTGAIFWFNRRFFEYTGATLDEMKGWGWQKVVHPDHLERVVGKVRNVLQTDEVWEDTFPVRGKDGRYRWFLSRAQPVRDAQGKVNRWFGTNTDITELREIQEQLHIAKTRFETLANTMPQLVWSTTPEGYHDYFNDRWYEFTGMPRGDSGWDWTNYLHPDDIKPTLEIWERCLATGEQYEVHYRFRRESDGVYRWFIGRALPMRDLEGKITRWIGTCTEISDLLEVQEALRAKEEQARAQAQELSAFMEAVPAITFVAHDRECCYISGSRATRHFMRVPDGTNLSVSGGQLLPVRFMKDGKELAPEEMPLQIAVASAAEVRDCEITCLFEDGSHRDILGNAVPLMDENGNVRGAVAAFVDITERKQAEEELHHSRELLSEAESLSHTGAWEWDLKTDQWSFSDEWVRIHGCRTRPRTAIDLLPMAHPEDRATIERAMEDVRRGIASYDLEHRIVRKEDGGVRIVHARGRYVRNANGEVEKVYGFVQDITDRKQAEQALLKAKDELARINQALEQKVQERTARLQEAINELEHFSYTITHDMRAPLRAMRGFATLLLDEHAQALPTEPRGYLRRISDAADRMDKLITDALQYSVLVRAQFPTEPVDTGALLHGIIESYPNLAPPYARITVDGDLPVVLGNKAGLTQCFSNLLSNAVKFVRPGQTPEIHVWSEELSTKEGQNGSPLRVRIWFEDKGIGIQKEFHEKIWDMFQRASRGYEGTGIGLALVRKAVERMDGRVGVESEPGKGSRFWIELNAAQTHATRNHLEEVGAESR